MDADTLVYEDVKFEKFTPMPNSTSIAEIESVIRARATKAVYMSVSQQTLAAMGHSVLTKTTEAIDQALARINGYLPETLAGWYLRPAGQGILPVRFGDDLPPMTIRFHSFRS